MPVRSLSGTYDYPSSSRQELYGDDQLVSVHWEGNLTFGAPACFRAPRALPWSEFMAQFVDPWAACDPDYDPSTPTGFRLDGDAFIPQPDKSLADLGVGHKSLICFRT